MEIVYYSKWGGSFNLSKNNYYWLTNIDGLTYASTSISSNIVGGIDGDEINNIQAQPRGIVIDLRVKSGVDVEKAKMAVLGIVKLKQSCTLKWTQNDRVFQISGTVESINMPRFSRGVAMQISIHCSKPYWEDPDETLSEISEAKNLHYFTDIPNDMLYFPEGGIPFGEYDTTRTRTFDNQGDVAVGMQIEVLAISTVTNPIIYGDGGKFFGVGYEGKDIVMSPGDKLTINTNVGEKSVYLNGVSKLDYVKPRSTWLQLAAGENTFSIDSDDSDLENMVFEIAYRQRYV